MTEKEIIKAAENDFDAITYSRLSEALKIKDADIPDQLFHYTSAEGLLGMLTHGEIWLTDYRFLNDKAEVVSASERLSEIIKKSMVKSESQFKYLYDNVYYFAGLPIPSAGYVFSLANSSDDLSQWRGYANEGRGFTIGFDAHELNKCPKRFYFSEIEYDKDKQSRVLELALKSYEDKLEDLIKLHPKLEEKLSIEAARSFDQLGTRFSMFCKHRSFKGESEWRYACWEEGGFPKPKIRVRNGILIPYISVAAGGAPKLPIKSIGIGPGFEGAEIEYATKILAKNCGYDVEIYNADTPFRRG